MNILKMMAVAILVLKMGVPLFGKSETGNRQISLQECLVETLKNNRALRIGHLDYDISRMVRRAADSLYIPEIEVTMENTEIRNPTASLLEGADIAESGSWLYQMRIRQHIPLGGQLTFLFNQAREKTNSSFTNLNPKFDAFFQLSLEQPLLRGFGNSVFKRDLRMAGEAQKGQYQELKNRMALVVLDLEMAYWDLVHTRMAMTVRREGLQLARDLVRMNLVKLKAGTIAELEILSARSDVANRESDVIAAESAIAAAEENLRMIMTGSAVKAAGEKNLIPIDTIDRYLDFTPPSMEEAIRLARLNNPEIARFEHLLKRHRIDIKYHKNRLLPELNLNLSYWTTGVSGDEIIYEGSGFDRKPVNIIHHSMLRSIEDALKGIYSSWNIRLSLKIPLLFREEKANVARVKLELNRLNLQMETVQQRISREIVQYLREIQNYRKRLKALEITSRLSMAQVQAEQKKFKAGVSTNYQVIEAQENHQRNRLLTLEVMKNMNRSVLQLQRILGTLISDRGIRL